MLADVGVIQEHLTCVHVKLLLMVFNNQASKSDQRYTSNMRVLNNPGSTKHFLVGKCGNRWRWTEVIFFFQNLHAPFHFLSHLLLEFSASDTVCSSPLWCAWNLFRFKPYKRSLAPILFFSLSLTSDSIHFSDLLLTPNCIELAVFLPKFWKSVLLEFT